MIGPPWLDEDTDIHDRDPHLAVKQWHHGYVGLALQIAGLVTILAAPEKHWIIYVALGIYFVGGLLMLDDIAQHYWQHFRPGYRSPVNRLWAWILRRCNP
jgi:hypothetical protein